MFSHIFNKIDNQILLISQLDDICVAGAISEFCEARDSGVVQSCIDATRYVI